MNVTGIIAEYNPFHNGHLYQLSYAKEKLKADYIIVAMSGDYVQRGAPALLPKHIRAEMALLGGADLVLELPAQFSSASAEFFAEGGVSLLEGTGAVTELCFGSEEGHVENMLLIARILTEEPEAYRTLLRQHLKEGRSFPCARNLALDRYLRASSLPVSAETASRLLSSPNNILGIEYCKALLKRKSSIKPVTLKRKGSGYHEAELKSRQAPSATAIRTHLQKSPKDTDTSPLKELMPEASLRLLESSVKRNGYLTEADFDLLLHYRLLSLTPEQTAEFQDISPELARRIQNRLNDYQGFSQFCELLKTREITRTRIQRGLMHVLLGIRKTPEEIPYARVLGFRRDAAPLLKEIKKRGILPLLTRPADAPELLSPGALAFLETNTRASNIYESLLCHKEGRAFTHEYQKPVVIL